MSVDIETPLMIRTRAQEDRPSTTFGYIEVMLLESVRTPTGASFNRETAIWCHVGIMSPQDYGDEVTSMVMKEPLVIRANPMMDSD